MNDGAHSRSEEKTHFSEDNEDRDGAAGEKPEDRHPQGAKSIQSPTATISAGRTAAASARPRVPTR